MLAITTAQKIIHAFSSFKYIVLNNYFKRHVRMRINLKNLWTVLLIFYTKVFPLQDSRGTQSRSLMLKLFLLFQTNISHQTM